MSTDTAEVFFALLALLAVAGAGGLVVARLLAPRSATAAAVVDTFAGPGLAFGAVVAAACMAGSLYFSDVADFIPCTLCWYQRIAMYPLVPLLGIAAWRRDPGVRLYGIVIAALGAPISIYHILLERDIIHESGACDPANPCNIVWVKRLGYLTIPTMALSGFALIITLLALSREEPPDGNPQAELEVERGRRGP